MSGAEQFKAAVSERSGPGDWRGGLERERRKAGRVGPLSSADTRSAWEMRGGNYFQRADMVAFGTS